MSQARCGHIILRSKAARLPVAVGLMDSLVFNESNEVQRVKLIGRGYVRRYGYNGRDHVDAAS